MQSVPSSIKYKKRFLRWFINHQLSENDDLSWFLDDLLADESMLNRIRFVDKIDSSPKGIIISTLPGDEPFIFFKGNVQSDNIYTAYHELQLYNDEPLYVKIKFPSAETNRLYQMLLREEKSYMKRNKAIATHLLDYLLEKEKKAQLQEKIDWALDTKNKEMFMFYTTEYKKLMEKSQT